MLNGNGNAFISQKQVHFTICENREFAEGQKAATGTRTEGRTWRTAMEQPDSSRRRALQEGVGCSSLLRADHSFRPNPFCPPSTASNRFGIPSSNRCSTHQ